MPSEVQASTNFKVSKGQHRAVFRNPRGTKRYYAFFQDGISSGTLKYEWSSDGTTWDNTPIDPGTIAPECYDVKIRDDGSQLVVWVALRTGTLLRYIRGTIADASSTISWGSLQSIDTLNTIMSEDHCVAIARTDNGRLVVAFTEDFNTMGKDYRRTKLIGSDGDGAAPSWSGETTWDDPSTNGNNDLKGDVWFGLESFSSSYPNRFLVAARIPNASDSVMYYGASAVPEWNGTSFSSLTKGVLIGTQLGETNTAKVLSLIIDEADYAHAIFWSTTGTDELGSKKAQTAGNDDWASMNSITTSDVDACTLTLDTGPATDELYAFYHDNADSTDFHYKKTPADTISWGSEQTITFSSDMIALTSWNRDVEGGLHIGLEDADTDIHYHEVDVSGAPAVGQPVMKRMQGVPTMPGSRDRIGGWN